MTTQALAPENQRVIPENPQGLSGILHTITQWLALAFAISIPLSNTITTILALLLVITCIAQMDGNTWLAVLKHPITIAALILFTINLIDLSYTIASKKEIALALRKSSRLLYLLLLLPLFAQAKWRLWACIGFLSAVVFSVLAALYAGEVIFKDTIFTSLYVAFAIFMLAHYSQEYKNYRWLTMPLAAFLTTYLLFIGSGRSGQVLFILLSMLFIAQRFKNNFKRQLLATVILTLVLTASLLMPSSFVNRHALAVDEIKEYMQKDEADIPYGSSLGTRLILAHNTWELIKQKPLFGWGTGAYRAAYAKYAPEAQVKEVARTNPHNQYLLTWAELGVPGLIALMSLFLTALWFFWRQPQLEGYLGVGFIIAFMAGCCVNSWLLDCTSTFFFVLFVALFAAVRGGTGSPQAPRAPMISAN